MAALRHQREHSVRAEVNTARDSGKTVPRMGGDQPRPGSGSK